MATMIELLGQQAVGQNTKDPLAGVADSFQGGVKTAIGLAQAKQSMEQQQQQLEEQKYNLQQKQMTGMLNGIRAAVFSPNPKIQKAALDRLEQQANGYNVAFDRMGLESVLSDPQLAVGVKKGISDLASGKALSNPEEFFSIISSQPAMLEWAMNEQSKNANVAGKFDRDKAILEAKLEAQKDLSKAKLDAQIEKAKNTPAKPTAFQQALDRKFADQVADFSLAGGAATVAKNLSTLDGAIDTLEKGKGSGGVKGLIPDIAGIKDVVAPEEKALQENILGVVQSNMKQVLGAQFTENEGKQILSRAFNPRLSPQENAKRVRKIRDELVSIAQAKQSAIDYVNGPGDGSLKGYKGKTSFTIDGVKVDVGSGIAQSTGQAPQAAAQAATPVAPSQPSIDIAGGIAKARAAGKTDAQIESFLVKQGLDAMAIQQALKGK